MRWLHDAHIHLADPFYEDIMQDILRNMQAAGIKACAVSTDAESSRRTLNLASENDLIIPFVGVHPENAAKGADGISGMASQNDAAGIGEIGLDSTLEAGMSMQRSVFEAQLDIAERLGRPVSVHSRRTLDMVLDTVSSFSIDSVLLHWFDGNKKQLARAMDMGCYASFGPVMLYAEDKQVLLSRTRHDRILVETDGPVRFSHCFGSRPARPDWIPSVAFCAANALGVSYDEMCGILSDNAMRYLGLQRQMLRPAPN